MIFKGIISFTVVIISTMEVIIGTAHRFEVEGSKIPAQSTRKKISYDSILHFAPSNVGARDSEQGGQSTNLDNMEKSGNL